VGMEKRKGILPFFELEEFKSMEDFESEIFFVSLKNFGIFFVFIFYGYIQFCIRYQELEIF